MTVEGTTVRVKGSKGELTQELHPFVSMEVLPEGVQVSVKQPEEKKQSAMWGTFSSLLKNMITGVSEGFEKKLEINGVGYNWKASGKKLTVNAGYSHPVDVELPEGVSVAVEANVLTLTSIDKQQLGHIAAEIRKIRPPEPYKGKGIKYADEHIRRKSGKQAAGGE